MRMKAFLMADMLRPRLDRLQELSKKVNAATDDAGRIVQGVESYLNDILHLGVRIRSLSRRSRDPRSFTVPKSNSSMVDMARSSESSSPTPLKTKGRSTSMRRRSGPIAPAIRSCLPLTTCQLCWTNLSSVSKQRWNRLSRTRKRFRLCFLRSKKKEPNRERRA